MVKKTIYLFLATAAIFTACKKDDTTVTKTTAQKVLGKWGVVSEVTVSYRSGVATTYTLPGAATDYADFRTDGKIYFYVENKYDTSTYKIINNQSITIDADSAQIKTLTDNSFVLEEKYYNGSDSTKSTISLKK